MIPVPEDVERGRVHNQSCPPPIALALVRLPEAPRNRYAPLGYSSAARAMTPD